MEVEGAIRLSAAVGRARDIAFAGRANLFGSCIKFGYLKGVRVAKVFGD